MKVLIVVGVTLVVLLVGTGVAAAVGVGVIGSWLEDLPDYSAEGAFDVMQPTEIYSADGVLLAKLFLQNRQVVELDKMSPWVAKATIAVEDERFYEHSGVDIPSVVRAAVTGYGGGSSITQQYVKQTVLNDEAFDITIRRKVREAFIAMEVERRYSKDEILEMYLNTIYYGDGAYGIEAASRNYFAKPSSELNIAEAATLAGIPQQPTNFNPYVDPEAVKRRRNHVLDRMLANDYITKDEYNAATSVELTYESMPIPGGGIYAAGYFVDAVKRILETEFDASIVFGGGLKVYTTLDSRMQAHAEDALLNALPNDGLAGALVSIEPANGYVRALVGGRNYEEEKFNLAIQASRQPGSSFKTFTLLSALKDGMSPNMPVDGRSPITIPLDGENDWEVSNAEGGSGGMTTLRSATAFSYNTAFALIINAIGAQKVVDMAHAAGIMTELRPYNSLTLGAQGVTVLEMASAYATLANSGVYNAPTFITKIEDRTGNPLYEYVPDPKQTIEPEVAYACTQILQNVVSSGTGTSARLGGRPVAGKTGTSENHRDVWFVGYTMDLATAVWVGYPQEREIRYFGSLAYGGTVCAPIFQRFMMGALEGFEWRDFPFFPAPPYDDSKYAGKLRSAAAIEAERRAKEEEEEEAERLRLEEEEAARRAAEEANRPRPQPQPQPQPEPDPEPEPDP
ncbi:MAG: PBP1A family penicillin-binding protein [Coriobacteriia bacterium]|nr:PBP1A family penicillin-binding protein [Coriobacteriia bacterium]